MAFGVRKAPSSNDARDWMFSPYGWAQTAVAPHHWRFYGNALSPFVDLNGSGLVLIGPLNLVSGPEVKIYAGVTPGNFLTKRYYRVTITTPANGDVSHPPNNIEIELLMTTFLGGPYGGTIWMQDEYPIQRFQLPALPLSGGPPLFPDGYIWMEPVKYDVPFTPGLTPA